MKDLENCMEISYQIYCWGDSQGLQGKIVSDKTSPSQNCLPYPIP